MNGGPVASARFDDTLANDGPFFWNGPKQTYIHIPCGASARFDDTLANDGPFFFWNGRKQTYIHIPCGASARFDDPRALAVSSDGVIFVVDYKNHVVREVCAMPCDVMYWDVM